MADDRESLRVRVGSRIYHAVDHVPPEGESPSYLRGDLIGDYKTINRAKRESRLWQQSTGRLGDGRLRIATKAPKHVQ